MTTSPNLSSYLRPIINIPGFKRRNVAASDLPIIDELSKPAGYDIGIDNLRLYFNTSPDTWYLIETDDGQVVACIANNLLPTGVYFGFNLVVRQDVMGRGLTRMLPFFQPWMGNASKDALPRFGALYPIIRDKYCAYEATLNSINMKALMVTAETSSYRIVSYSDEYNAKLIAYDSAVIGFNRAEFMKAYTEDIVNSKTLIAIDTTDQVVGYTILRKYPTSWTIQPLYADSGNIAYDLYRRAACCLREGDSIFSIFLAKSIIAMNFMHQLSAELCYTEQRWMTNECVELCENRIDFSRVYSIHEFYPA